ncbi:hypothetical protein [Streptomyces platensis]|uniref:hypothetical protein n=1 Tax=Streptomyces platensis TaxID=58346 RepID=UPI00386306B1|nr:hypothetical protein OG962_29225 [Streptomyces platensis]
MSGKAPAAPGRAAGERQSAGAATDGGAAQPGGRTGRAPKAVPAQIVQAATVTVQTEDIAAAASDGRRAHPAAGGRGGGCARSRRAGRRVRDGGGR